MDKETLDTCEGWLDHIYIRYSSRKGGQRLFFAPDEEKIVAALGNLLASQVVKHFYPDLCYQLFSLLYISSHADIIKLRRRFQRAKGVAVRDAVALVEQHNTPKASNSTWYGVFGERWRDV